MKISLHGVKKIEFEPEGNSGQINWRKIVITTLKNEKLEILMFYKEAPEIEGLGVK